MELRDYVRLAERLGQKREKIEISFSTLAGPEEQVIYGLLTGVLGDIGQLHLENTVQLVLGELLRNAEAVVLQEAYLKSQGLSEWKPAAATEFRKQILENRKALRRDVPAKGPAGMIFEAELSGDSLILSVSNRGGLSQDMVQKIENRLELAGRQQGVEGLSELPDMETPTGRGLGLVVSILSLRNVGISRHLFYYQHNEKRTTFTFEVPVNLASQNKLKEIETELIAEVRDLPSLPEQLNRIMQLCDSEDSSIKQIAEEIQRDQAIAGQLIKLANSGGFAGGRIVDLAEAVKVVGLKHISQFLLQIGSFNILVERYGEARELTEHPMRVGYFSRSLARRHERAKLADNAYVAGLLHDIGKVVLLTATKNKKDLEHISQDRDFRDRVRLEELACGASHALIGALLAHKWNFPDILKLAIEYHHSPARAALLTDEPKEHYEIIMIVYMANAISDYLDKRLAFWAVAPVALEYFNLTTEDAFKMTAATLNGEFLELSER
ncbi:MAG: HDOD domain-containing protein [bacterium]|nr:HDOD domain-containing protein [bacterium]